MTKKVYVLRSDDIRERVCRVVREVGKKSGKLVEVELRPYVKRRTSNQNSAMHCTWRDFGNEVGWDEDEVKEYFKDKYGPKIERMIDDEIIEFPKPSRDYSAAESSHMIDTVHRIAAAYGIVLPDIRQND